MQITSRNGCSENNSAHDRNFMPNSIGVQREHKPVPEKRTDKTELFVKQGENRYSAWDLATPRADNSRVPFYDSDKAAQERPNLFAGDYIHFPSESSKRPEDDS